jgi:hypothetical protein
VADSVDCSLTLSIISEDTPRGEFFPDAAMTTNAGPQTLAARLSLVFACALFGAAIGLMAISLLPLEPVSTWTAVADHPGGLLTGMLLGALGGAYLARDLSNTALWWSTAVAVVLTAGTLWSLALAT